MVKNTTSFYEKLKKRDERFGDMLDYFFGFFHRIKKKNSMKKEKKKWITSHK